MSPQLASISAHSHGDESNASFRRAVTLGASIMVALVSGTNYAVANYAPQLAQELNLSSTQINIVGTAGNLGVYISGPLWGIIVDARGPRFNLAAASVLLLVGYLGIRAFFLHTIPYTGTGSLVLLCIFAFFTGAGSSAGLSGGMNSVAKSFPDKTRATAAGSVLAGFGLSAFLFSTISHTFFPGNTGDFLFLLAIGCFIPMFLGVFLVVPIPPPKHRPHPHHTEESNWGRIASSSSATGYLPIPDQSDAESTSGAETEEDDDETHTPRVRTRRDGTIIELSPSRSFKSNEGDDEEGILTKVTSRVSVVPSVAGGDDGEGMTGMRLMKELDFWILAAIVCCLSGSGLMWINNCGLSTLALVTKGNPVYDPELLSKLQATQVSTISIWNCAGRILLGVITDVAKHRFSIRRIHFMSLVSSLFILSQVAALYTTDVRSLWIVSSLLGVAYGGLFGLAPVICLEWFGLANFSLNWGFVSMSPILGGNVANLVYGRVYDSHTVGKIAKAALALVRSPPVLDPSDRSHDCFLGQGCYVQAFHVTTTATVLALALSLFAGWRREKASRERKRRASMLVVGSAA